MNAFSACIITLVLVLPCTITAADCTYKHSSGTFDLSSLVKKQGSYFAKDTYARSARPFDYYFNLCHVVPKPSSLCNGWDNIEGGDTVAAYQFENTSAVQKCTPLGVTERTTYEILDTTETKNNAFIGVRVIFSGGAECKKEGNAKRKFAVNVRCTKEKTTLAPISTVSEDLEEGCLYEVDIFDIAGCPTECHSKSHQELCSTHGVCGMDSGSNRARCFCNDGWGGDKCDEAEEESSGPSSSSVNTVLIVFVIILLALLLGLSYVLYGRIKALNADTNPYGAFEDQVPNSASHM